MKGLVLGYGGLAGESANYAVSSFGWSDLDKLANIRDFDRILVVLSDSEIPPDEGEHYATHFKSSTVAALIESGVEIVVLGDPRARVEWNLESRGFGGCAIHWAGINPAWDDKPGERVVDSGGTADPLVGDHLAQIKSWQYSLASWKKMTWLSDAFNRLYFPDGNRQLEVSVNPLLSTRYGTAVAFQLQYRASDARGRRVGNVRSIPRTERSLDQDVTGLVQSMFGLDFRSAEPAWLDGAYVVGESEINDRLSLLRERQTEIAVAIQREEQKRTESRRMLGLLYEQGPTLEVLVREALRELGGQVEDPTAPRDEDGWLVAEEGGVRFEAVLEIGGTRATSHSEDRLRQLMMWTDKSITIKGRKWKGMFLGNSSNQRPPAERSTPFGDQWTRRAREHGFVALRTEDLFLAVEASRRGDFDRLAFWSLLRDACGPIEEKDLLAALGGKSTGKRGAT